MYTNKTTTQVNLITRIYNTGDPHDVLSRLWDILKDGKIHINDCIDQEGNTILMYATIHGNKNMVEKLIDAGANRDIGNRKGKTALELAARFGHIKTVEYLISLEHIRKDKKSNSTIALFTAAKYGHKDVVLSLLRSGAYIGVMDKYANTALHHAAYKKHRQMVGCLVEKGIDINVRNMNGSTALCVALHAHDNTYREGSDIVQELVNAHYGMLTKKVKLSCKERCPITSMTIQNPIFIKTKEKNTLCEMYAAIRWLWMNDYNPFTRERVIPESIAAQMSNRQKRLDYILLKSLSYPLEKIIKCIQKFCWLRRIRMRSINRSDYRKHLLQRVITSYKIKPVVQLQARARGISMRTKMNKDLQVNAKGLVAPSSSNECGITCSIM